MTLLTDVTPAIVMMGEKEALKEWFFVCKHSVWSPSDLEDWLMDKEGLADSEAEVYSCVLIDELIDSGIGEEYGGITPWCGEGYHFFEDPF